MVLAGPTDISSFLMALLWLELHLLAFDASVPLSCPVTNDYMLYLTFPNRSRTRCVNWPNDTRYGYSLAS